MRDPWSARGGDTGAGGTVKKRIHALGFKDLSNKLTEIELWNTLPPREITSRNRNGF